MNSRQFPVMGHLVNEIACFVNRFAVRVRFFRVLKFEARLLLGRKERRDPFGGKSSRSAGAPSCLAPSRVRDCGTARAPRGCCAASTSAGHYPSCTPRFRDAAGRQRFHPVPAWQSPALDAAPAAIAHQPGRQLAPTSAGLQGRPRPVRHRSARFGQAGWGPRGPRHRRARGPDAADVSSRSSQRCGRVVVDGKRAAGSEQCEGRARRRHPERHDEPEWRAATQFRTARRRWSSAQSGTAGRPRPAARRRAAASITSS